MGCTDLFRLVFFDLAFRKLAWHFYLVGLFHLLRYNLGICSVFSGALMFSSVLLLEVATDVSQRFFKKLCKSFFLKNQLKSTTEKKKLLLQLAPSASCNNQHLQTSISAQVKLPNGAS
jgi:Zn-dependent membrane protease YugP